MTYYKKLKAKEIEILKRAPNWLYHGNLSKHQKYRDKLNLERHWFSGMVLVSNGRSRLKGDLKKLADTYNQKENLVDNILTSKVKEKYDRWDYKY